MHIRRMKVITAECFRLPFENKNKIITNNRFGKQSRDSRKS